MESSRMTASNFAHSRARQTLLRQISQEELDHGNQILLLLVPEKLCSLIMTSKVSLPHIYLVEKQRDASLWTRLSSLTRVSKNFFAHVGWSNCTWFCSSAVFHSQLPDSASKASLPCLQTLAQEPWRSTWQGSQRESGWVYLWMHKDDPWMHW